MALAASAGAHAALVPSHAAERPLTGMLFAARSLGHPVLLYDGSFEDWSAHADYPVENPSAKGAR